MSFDNPENLGELFDKADTLATFQDYVAAKGIADPGIVQAIQADLDDAHARIGQQIQFQPGSDPILVTHGGQIFSYKLDAAGKPTVSQEVPVDAATITLAGATPNPTPTPTPQPTPVPPPPTPTPTGTDTGTGTAPMPTPTPTPPAPGPVVAPTNPDGSPAAPTPIPPPNPDGSPATPAPTPPPPS